MKKGFTLIELLAVIIILGIIALITTPIIQNAINSSSEEAFENSVNALVNLVDMDYNENARIGTQTYEFSENSLVYQGKNGDSDIELDYNGEINGGTGTITNNKGKISGNVENDDYKASISNSKVTVTKK